MANTGLVLFGSSVIFYYFDGIFKVCNCVANLVENGQAETCSEPKPSSSLRLWERWSLGSREPERGNSAAIVHLSSPPTHLYGHRIMSPPTAHILIISNASSRLIELMVNGFKNLRTSVYQPFSSEVVWKAKILVLQDERSVSITKGMLCQNVVFTKVLPSKMNWGVSWAVHGSLPNVFLRTQVTDV